MPRTYVDFAHVPPHQADMHDRLINWARWCASSNRGQSHPMFRGVKPAQHWDGITARLEVDAIDAQFVEKAVAKLPEAHRWAVRWCYVYRISPSACARFLACSLEMLLHYVVDGRQMLINRNV